MNLRRILLSVLFVAALIYAGDYGWLRYRIGKNVGLGAIQIRSYYAVPQKNGKVEFMFNDPEMETCSRSLFPHLGYRPCWYVARKPEKRIDM